MNIKKAVNSSQPIRNGLARWLILAAIVLATSGAVQPEVVPQNVGATTARAGQVRTGVSQDIRGVTVTLDELHRRPEPAPWTTPRQASPRRAFNGQLTPAPKSSAALNGPFDHALAPVSRNPDLPQPIGDVIPGPTFADSGFVPPDTMGAVGPTQFLFAVNGRFRASNKSAPHTMIFDMNDAAFWGSNADPAGVSDPHVRYDRATQRWFITEIDVANTNNHILLAVSSSPDLSTASWTQYELAATGSLTATDQNCFADYDTPGIDQNAIYIGANMFGGGVAPCPNFTYVHSNLYVIQKAGVLTGTAHLTTFYNVVTGTNAIPTIQGVDSFDSLSTGYAIAVKATESPSTHLNVWQINNSGSLSPTLSGPTPVVISAENGALGGVLTANNVASGFSAPMDDLDDRLFAAVIRHGHLWTAHNLAVDSTGNSNGVTRDREGVRWYDITVPGLTLNQSGTVFDNAGSGFLNYWMGTIMPSGQGHAAMGLNRANSTTAVQAGALGRLSGDAAGTLRAFSLFENSVDSGNAAWPYTDGGSTNRWGDYSYTSLDPCDDMTLWTTQEYIRGSTSNVDWGVAAAKLQAPPPATPASTSPLIISGGLANLTVVITGTAINGSGFYDTPASLSTESCRKRITAAVSGGVVVNSITYTDPTHVTLQLSIFGATAGLQTVSITNPDGQTSAAAILNVPRAAYLPLISR